MKEYVITDDDDEELKVKWDEDGFLCSWLEYEGFSTEIFFTPDQAKKLAAFIMAQVKEEQDELD